MFDAAKTVGSRVGPVSDDKTYRETLKHFAGNWIWRAADALVLHPEFQGSPSWLQARLGISLEEAVDALEGLEKLGIIRREGGKVNKGRPQFIVPDDLNSRSVKVQNYVNDAIQNVSRLGEHELGVGYSLYSLLTKEQVFEVYSRIQKMLEDLDQSPKTSKSNKLFNLTFAGVEVEVTQDGGTK